MAPVGDIVVSLSPEHVALLEAATEALAGHEAHKRAQAERITALEKMLTGYVVAINEYRDLVREGFELYESRCRQRATRIEAEQRDIVACQDYQGDRLGKLENRIGMGEASDKPRGCSVACGQGFGCDGSCCAPADPNTHRFEFEGTRGQVAALVAYVRLMTDRD